MIHSGQFPRPSETASGPVFRAGWRLLPAVLALAACLAGIGTGALAQTEPPLSAEAVNAARAAFVAGDYSLIASVAVPAAEAGNAAAQNLLGIAYDRGLGIAQSPSLARYWYRQAAAQGLARAQANLARDIFDDGKATEADLIEAVAAAEASAAQGFADAHMILARAYVSGTALPVDGALAVLAAERGVEMGDTNAIRYLAWLLAYSGLVDPDLAQARTLYARAADDGDVDAAVALGYMQQHGDGGPVDLDGALATYVAATLIGSGQAPFEAAVMIRDNPGHFPDQLAGLSLCFLDQRLSHPARVADVGQACAAWALDFDAAEMAAARAAADTFDTAAIVPRSGIELEPGD